MFLFCFIAAWTCVVLSVMLVVCSLVFVLCLTVLVNCLLNAFAICVVSCMFSLLKLLCCFFFVFFVD